jgi:hypothetical protein
MRIFSILKVISIRGNEFQPLELEYILWDRDASDTHSKEKGE